MEKKVGFEYYVIDKHEYGVKKEGSTWIIDYGWDTIPYDVNDPTEVGMIRHIYDFVNGLDKQQNKDDICFMLTSHNDVIQDKTFPYNTYAMLTINSNFNKNNKDEYKNFLYKDNIKKDIGDFLEEAKKDFPDGKIPAMKTVEKHIKTLLACDLPLIKIENTPNGVAYKLKADIDGKYYVRIPYIQVRELTVSTNKNMLKLFVILTYMCDTETHTKIDRKFLARQLGLSDNSTRGLDVISTMTTTLANLGFIEIKVETKTEYDKDLQKIVVKTINSYRLTTLDEYKEAKKRGKITKTKK